jgi:WD40 repeat protein
VNAVAFSPDGKRVLTGSEDKICKLWDIPSGKELMSFSGHHDGVLSVAFSPDGRFALSGSKDRTIRIWDISSEKEIAQYVSFENGEWIMLTPEGYFNASPRGARLLNVRVGNTVHGIEKHFDLYYRPDIVKSALQHR